MQDVTWDARNDVSWIARNLFVWKVRNLNLAFLTVFSVSSVTWMFDIFGNFKMNVRAFQCVYKCLKLIIDALGDFLIMKTRDCLGNKQDSFPKAVLCMFSYEKLHDMGTNEFGKLWEDFGKFYMWKKEKNQI